MAATGEAPLRAGGARVLVTDGHHRAALAACRGLAKAGFSVAAAASEKPAVSHWSRSVRKRLLVSDALEPDRFVDGLVDATANGRFRLLVPGTDVSLNAISERRERFPPGLLVGLPSKNAVRRSLDKAVLLAAAEQAGIPCPASAVCTTADGVAEAAADLGPNVIVKPARPVAAAEAHERIAPRIVLSDELRRRHANVERPVIVQRYEAGSTVVWVSGVMTGSGLRAVGAARFGRSWPPDAGSASFATTFTPRADLVAGVERLLGIVGWTGMFQLQLLEQGGRYRAIDLNPRPYASMAVDIAAGANIPAVWCSYLLGLDPEFERARPGFSFRWGGGETRNVVARLRRGDIGRAKAVLAPARPVVHAHVRVDDPGPAFAAALALVKRRLISCGHRLRAAPGQPRDPQPRSPRSPPG